MDGMKKDQNALGRQVAFYDGQYSKLEVPHPAAFVNSISAAFHYFLFFCYLCSLYSLLVYLQKELVEADRQLEALGVANKNFENWIASLDRESMPTHFHYVDLLL